MDTKDKKEFKSIMNSFIYTSSDNIKFVGIKGKKPSEKQLQNGLQRSANLYILTKLDGVTYKLNYQLSMRGEFIRKAPTIAAADDLRLFYFLGLKGSDFIV